MQIQPLTHRNSEDEVYQRSLEITLQIEATCELPAALLIQRAQRSDSLSADYLQEECLIYLIRDYLRKGQKIVVNDLSEILLLRSVKFIYKHFRALSLDMANDAYGDVVTDLFGKIFDLESDRADFLQVRYWYALKMLTISTFRKYYVGSELPQSTISLSELDDSDQNTEDHTNVSILTDPALISSFSIEQGLLIQEGLSMLDKRCQTVFILYHYWGWQIESNDPAEPTISRHFQVTGRTIHNWLKKAEEQLESWRGKQ